MTIDYDAILKTIVSANNKSDTTNSKNILKTDTIGNTIVGRFIPNMKDVEHSLFPYFHHGWTSLADGITKIFHTCLNTYKKKCPTCGRSVAMWKSNNSSIVNMSKKIRRRANTMANFYVISDTNNPENNGTVKIFRYGKQIKDKVDMALTGDDKDIYGQRIWRLDEQGCNFRIKCVQNSESDEAWPTYTNSSFLPQSKIEGMTDEKITQILNSVFDLTKLFTEKSAEEMLADLNKHFMINEIMTIDATTASSVTEEVLKQGITQPTPTPIQVDNTLVVDTAPIKEVSQSTTNSNITSDKKNTVGEDQVDAMLKELEGMGVTNKGV